MNFQVKRGTPANERAFVTAIFIALKTSHSLLHAVTSIISNAKVIMFIDNVSLVGSTLRSPAPAPLHLEALQLKPS